MAIHVYHEEEMWAYQKLSRTSNGFMLRETYTGKFIVPFVSK
jgi:hypothetical protein